MIGLILQRDFLVLSRQQRIPARVLMLVGFLLLTLGFCLSALQGYHLDDYRRWLQIAHSFGGFLIGIQYILLFVVTPMFGVSTIIPDKTSGTLIELMVTPIRPRDIIIGKWLSVVVRTFHIPIIPLPLAMAVSGSFYDTLDLPTTLFKPLIWLPMVAAITVLISTLMRYTRDAIVIALVIPGCILGGFLYVIQLPFGDPIPLLPMMVWSGLFTILSLLWAIGYLRSAVFKHSAPPTPWIRLTAIKSPPMGDDPLRWLESKRTRFVRLRWFPPIVQYLCFGLICGWMACDSRSIEPVGVMIGVIAVLVVGAQSAISIITERDRKTWEILLTSPLTAREIICGKVAGILDGVKPWLLAYFISTVVVTTWVDSTKLPGVLTISAEIWGAVLWFSGIGIRQSYHRSSATKAIGATTGFAYLRIYLYAAFILVIKLITYIPSVNLNNIDQYPLLIGLMVLLGCRIDHMWNLRAVTAVLDRQMQPKIETVSSKT